MGGSPRQRTGSKSGERGQAGARKNSIAVKKGPHRKGQISSGAARCDAKILVSKEPGRYYLSTSIHLVGWRGGILRNRDLSRLSGSIRIESSLTSTGGGGGDYRVRQPESRGGPFFERDCP